MKNLIQDTYLGQKGYTILKNELSIEEEKQIRNDLTITPFSLKNYAPKKSFSVYRESKNKFYLPQFYGTKHFGIPKKYVISEGDNIDLEFTGKLRENQEIVVETYMNHIKNTEYGGGLLHLPCAYGKTVLSLYLISQIKKKTLVIVNKEFLMNQWIERIQQFLPKARVGRIQGPHVDIENKDIVFGMVQSICEKEYPLSIFNSFGLSIFDEVHHMSATSFSNCLFKIVTKNRIGLSATMDRKDKTSHVFKMFLGETIFKGKGKDREVVVRVIKYKVDDNDFNEVKLDYRGNPAYSSMISKLCEYIPRSEFILMILSDILLENKNQQILILAHNKNILNYLYNAIIHRNIATVGYYIGGMKPQALKETENKQVVIATYSMAAEGLDIKTLSCLIMATPKTDIEQSVGRTLRDEDIFPNVVDIVDSHSLFKNQYKKREVFYKKKNYKIVETTNLTYNSDINKWKILFSPKIKNKQNKISCSRDNKNININNDNNLIDKSITNESDSESDNIIESENISESESDCKDKYLSGKCLI